MPQRRRRDATPVRRVFLTPVAEVQQSTQRVTPLNSQALEGYNSDSLSSAESRYDEHVDEEAGYEPGPEQIEP